MQRDTEIAKQRQRDPEDPDDDEAQRKINGPGGRTRHHAGRAQAQRNALGRLDEGQGIDGRGRRRRAQTGTTIVSAAPWLRSAPASSAAYGSAGGIGVGRDIFPCSPLTSGIGTLVAGSL
ncbi:MAG: hypothetical protein AMXMBFR59_38270 [Rhodanobacteraceae bacterium]